jgi:CubicO group peptidase (beta-lactamase class C family)
MSADLQQRVALPAGGRSGQVRKLGRGVLAGGLVLLLLYAAAWVTVDRYGASRAIVWLEADTGDIDRFPARTIAAGPEVVELPLGEPLDLTAVWPTGDDPERVLDETGTVAFLILQDGRLRVERYAEGHARDELRTSFSVVKSVVSTLIGLAIDDGAIGSLDDPITDYLPELLDRDAEYGRITIRHLVTMSSGLRYVERFHPFSDDAQTYYGTDLRATGLSARVAQAPGQAFLYNNYNLLLEGLILERATGERVADYLARRLWQPMGAEAAASWSLDSEASGFEKMESGFNAVPRDYARFGLLIANAGRIDDRQVVPAGWLELATSAERSGSAAGFYAAHWWTGTPDGLRFPEGHVLAAGNHGQFIYVAPDRDIVIVRLGDTDGTAEWPRILASIAARL